MEKKISMTDFIDFSVRAGTSKMTKVKEVRDRGDYHPATDYWKKMRDHLVKFHREQKEKNWLETVIDKVSQKKKNNYATVIKSHGSFLGRKKIEWFEPTKGTWTHGDLSVNVNPELGLMINGTPHLIKLYFKENKRDSKTILNKQKLQLIFAMMKETLSESVEDGTVFAVLNAKTGKLITMTRDVENINILLRAEATAFTEIWENAI